MNGPASGGQYNLLFSWFVGLNVDNAAWDHSTFSFIRGRLFEEEIAQWFFENTVLLVRIRNLVSDELFSVDGALLEVASHESFRPKDGGDDGYGGDLLGRPRSNETHASTIDPDTRLSHPANTLT